MVLLNLAAAIRPGWLHDSSITPSELFPHPTPLDGGPICQESFVNFNIKMSVFVTLMSPRAVSSRPGIRTFLQGRQLWKGQGIEGEGSRRRGILLKAKAPPRLCLAAG